MTSTPTIMSKNIDSRVTKYTNSFINANKSDGEVYKTLRELFTERAAVIKAVLLDQKACSHPILQWLLRRDGMLEIVIGLLEKLVDDDVWAEYDQKTLFGQFCSYKWAEDEFPKFVRVLNLVPHHMLNDFVFDLREGGTYTAVHSIVCCTTNPIKYLTILSGFDSFQNALTAQDPFTLDTPLHRAIEYGRSDECIQLLLSSTRGMMALDMPNESKKTPFELLLKSERSSLHIIAIDAARKKMALPDKDAEMEAITAENAPHMPGYREGLWQLDN